MFLPLSSWGFAWPSLELLCLQIHHLNPVFTVCSLCVSLLCLPSRNICVCVQVSPFYRAMSHNGLGCTLMTFQLDSIFKDPISKTCDTLRYLRLGLQHIFYGEYNSTHNNSKTKMTIHYVVKKYSFLIRETEDKWVFGCCSVAQSCPALCDPMDCSKPDFPIFYHLPEPAQTTSTESEMPSSHLISIVPSPDAFCLSQHQGLEFPAKRFFTSGFQSIGASASASVLPMKIQS